MKDFVVSFHWSEVADARTARERLGVPVWDVIAQKLRLEHVPDDAVIDVIVRQRVEPHASKWLRWMGVVGYPKK